MPRAPRRGGLGPLGYKAIQEAAEVFAETQEKKTTGIPIAAEEDQPLSLDWYFFPQSSRVTQAAYDAAGKRILVRFVKPVGAGGTPWVYEQVPKRVWDRFVMSESKGQFINHTLNAFPYHAGDF
jgi:hypothetical protein